MKHFENDKETRSIPEKIQSSFRLALAKAAVEILSKFEIKMNISPESLEQLQKIDDYLKHGSIIIYANHTSMLDAILGIPSGIHHLPHLRKVMYLLAEKYAIPNSKQKLSYLIAPVTKVANSLGVVAVPVPQKLSEQVSEIEKQKGLERLANYEKTRDDLMNKRGTACGYTPGATRSAELPRFKAGIVKTAQLYPEALCCPMGLVPKGENIFELVVGEPTMASEMVKTIIGRIATESDPAMIKQLYQEGADLFGYEVAALLPEHMRGVYADKSLDDVV